MARARLSRVYNFSTAQARARRVLPRPLFDFIDGGSEDEITLRDNHEAYGRVDVPAPGCAVGADAGSDDIGSRSRAVDAAPAGALWWDTARLSRWRAGDGPGRGEDGHRRVLSTASVTPLPDVTAAATGPIWFQLYFPGTRDGAVSLVERAQTAGFGALFVTVDQPIRGNQEQVRSNDRVVPPRPNLRNAIRYGPHLSLHPRWTAGYLRDGLPNGITRRSGSARPSGPPEGPTVPGGTRWMRPNVTWDDVAAIRKRWTGPYVVKGILTAEDARRAVECGADGVVVSNHGGRQLDGAPATLRVLPEVRAAVGPDIQVLIDGGIRRGSDALKAIALGATATMIGRPYLYGPRGRRRGRRRAHPHDLPGRLPPHAPTPRTDLDRRHRRNRGRRQSALALDRPKRRSGQSLHTSGTAWVMTSSTAGRPSPTSASALVRAGTIPPG